jgi:hypothetical protein
MYLEDAGGTVELSSRIGWLFTDAGATTEDSAITFWTRTGGAAIREVARIDDTGLLNVTTATEQIRASYSAVVYASHTVASTGVYTITQTGASLALSKAVNVGTATWANDAGELATSAGALFAGNVGIGDATLGQPDATYALHVYNSGYSNIKLSATGFNYSYIGTHSTGLRLEGNGGAVLVRYDDSNYAQHLIGSSGAYLINPVGDARDLAFFASPANWQGMVDGVFIGDCTTAPTGDPASGGFFYGSGGALYWRGSSGTITKLADA